MHRLTIHNFGPIRDATIEVTPFQIFIGPQASGKSTIGKLIYYFLHVRDEVISFIVEAAEAKETKRWPDVGWDLKKHLQRHFVEFWGPVPQSPDVQVVYDYGQDYSLVIQLDKQEHKYITPHFSDRAWTRFSDIFYETRSQFEKDGTPTIFTSTIGKLAARQNRKETLENVRSKCVEVFGNEKELLFIPAGRSLLSTLADQMQNIHPHMLDFPMRQFVELVNSSNALFERSLDEIIRERQALSSIPVRFSAVRRVQTYIEKILKGEYRHDREGGKLFITPDMFTKINYASSGQQEAVWILLSLFLLVLEGSEARVMIEEPEAHLFPEAQDEIVKLIAFIHNSMKCDFVLTTHSPYLLSSINNLLYANQLAGDINNEKVAEVIPRYLWLKSCEVSGYFVDNGTVSNLLMSDLPALKTELLDTASDLINDEYEKLLALEKDL